MAPGVARNAAEGRCLPLLRGHEGARLVEIAGLGWLKASRFKTLPVRGDDANESFGDQCSVGVYLKCPFRRAAVKLTIS